MNKKIKTIAAWLLVIVWMLLIFRFSSEVGKVSGSRSQSYAQHIHQVLEKLNVSLKVHRIELILRKTAHVLEYMVLTLLTYKALRKSRYKSKKYLYLIVFIFPFAYACIDELHQLFTPGRDGRMGDVLIDSTGIMLALAGIYAYKAISARKAFAEARASKGCKEQQAVQKEQK